MRLIPAWCAALLACCLAAAPLTIRYPDNGDHRHEYYVAVLDAALEQAGKPHHLEAVAIPRHLRSYLALQDGQIDLLWLLPNKERDQQYHRVDVPLTDGLIGTRILLIAPGDKRFQAIDGLDALRRSGLVAGLGRGWQDVAIWDHNGLHRYEHNGDWNDLFRLLASRSRGVDYLPRGANEILDEAAAHPELAIEPHLLLRYQSDFYFYTRDADLAQLLTYALLRLKADGRLAKLFEHYFRPAMTTLQLDQRVVIPLGSPP
jgi:hypothetical protein